MSFAFLVEQYQTLVLEKDLSKDNKVALDCIQWEMNFISCGCKHQHANMKINLRNEQILK